jgi:aspartate aminotransferase-like enzyme
MGLRLFARAPAEGMTVAHVPEGIEGKALLSMLEERHGIKLADGQDSLKGRIFRLAHMGAIGAEDVLDALSALEQSLTELGHVVTPGAGVEAARKAGAVN